MDVPAIFNNINPSAISRSKAEEMLLYVRYLLNREKEAAKLRVYENLKILLEDRLEELNEREILPQLELPLRSFPEQNSPPLANTDQG